MSEIPDITPEDLSRMTDGLYHNEYPTGPDPITKFKADLRAKVGSLPPILVDSTPWSDDSPHNLELCVRRGDVIALIDGDDE